MSSILDRIYKASPVWFQNLGITLYGAMWRARRFGGAFSSLTDQFLEREAFSYQDWQTYQTEQLRSLFGIAWQSSYYRKLMENLGWTPNKINQLSLQELDTFPLLEKQELRAYPEDFLTHPRNRPRLYSYHTSGTTGTPLEIMMSAQTHQAASAAYEARCRRWAGINYKMSRAMIGGRMVVPRGDSSPPFWRYNWAERQLYMSAFHISPTNTRDYVKAMNHYQPAYLVGYSVSHYLLACMIEEQGLQVHQPQVVLTSSEKLTSEMRAKIEQVYRCKVFDGYSGVEACCLASECEHHTLHISPDVGIIEIIDENGNNLGYDEPGQIVATGLLNHDQPLIRYKTGDIGILSQEKCPCGRQMQVLKEIVGRMEDVVVGPDGRRLVRFHGIFVGLPHIREGQVIQEDLSDFSVRLVVTPDFNDQDRQILLKRFQERLGKIRLTINVVDAIERTTAGKFKAVISKIDGNK